MNALIPVYVHTTNFIADRADLMRHPKERGAGFVEYAALVVLAALVLAAIAAIVPSKLKSGITSKIDEIFNQSGDGGSGLVPF